MGGRAAALAGLLLAGCACRPSAPPGSPAWNGAPPAVRMPPLRPAPALVASPHVTLAPPTPSDRLASVAKAADPVAALLVLAREAPEVLRDAPDEAFAPLLSDRVRLVDLRDVLRDGGDASPWAVGPFEGSREEGDRTDPRVERIAASVRGALEAGAWDASKALLAVRPRGLLVVQTPDRLLEVEKALDRFAVAGGPSVRIAALFTQDAGALAKTVGLETGSWTRAEVARVPDVPGLEDGVLEAGDAPSDRTADVQASGYWRFSPYSCPVRPPSLALEPPAPVPALESWTSSALDDATWGRATAVASVPVLRVPLSGDRCIAAGRTSRWTYLRWLDPPSPPSDTPVPVLSTLVTGTILAGRRAGDRWRADLVQSELVQPIALFESRVSSASPSVRVELPEVRFARLGVEMPSRAGAAAFIRPAGGAGTACLFRVEAVDDAPTPHPAWRWSRALPGPSAPWERTVGGLGWSVSLRIERRAADGRPVGPVDAPRLLLTEGEDGVVALQDEEAYVAEGAAAAAEARADGTRVHHLVTGLIIRAKAAPRPDGSVVVEGTLRLEDRDRPLRTFTAIASPARVSVQLPRTWRTDVPFRIRLRPGETAEWPAAARTSRGSESLRLRVTLEEPVRLFTPWRRQGR